jgi:transposase
MFLVSRARLVITAITKQGLSQAEAARTYGLSEATVSRLMARYRAEGEAAFEPRSKRHKASPTALPAELVDLILRLRKELAETGLDAGPETIGWHLTHRHGHQISRATIARYLGRAGLVVPKPKKRPKSSYTRWTRSRRPLRSRLP